SLHEPLGVFHIIRAAYTFPLAPYCSSPWPTISSATETQVSLSLMCDTLKFPILAPRLGTTIFSDSLINRMVDVSTRAMNNGALCRTTWSLSAPFRVYTRNNPSECVTQCCIVLYVPTSCPSSNNQT